ncbi:hypothetical protein SORBI_3007G136000 [Sorghum bicolor]|uniref:Uncharacterized protein n=1 Tax=Sorghum bicolor TaxID=4558 RepID=A0A1B6PHQ0_SORBI|nr:hypothetical protein SORBI_3007G136000 [Sorghum bicolor]
MQKEFPCKKLTLNLFRWSEARARPRPSVVGPTEKRAIIDRVRRYARQRHNGVAMISRLKSARAPPPPSSSRPSTSSISWVPPWWWRRRHHHVRTCIRLPDHRGAHHRPAGPPARSRGHSHWPLPHSSLPTTSPTRDVYTASFMD